MSSESAMKPNVRQIMAGLRNIRSRVNANEFMTLFCPDKPFDSYHADRWTLFRDDPVGFWCNSDSDQQKLLEDLIIDSLELD